MELSQERAGSSEKRRTARKKAEAVPTFAGWGQWAEARGSDSFRRSLGDFQDMVASGAGVIGTDGQVLSSICPRI